MRKAQKVYDKKDWIVAATGKCVPLDPKYDFHYMDCGVAGGFPHPAYECEDLVKERSETQD